MLRIILGVIVGFVVWSILWLGSDQLMIQTIGWYGDHQHAFERAMVNKEAFLPDLTILIMNIVRSVIISLISGYIAVLAAGENRRSTMILGICLLLFGLMVEVVAWNYLPVWYHLVFLVLLIPATIAGGKIKNFSPAAQTA
jgi:hypothetical protein